MDFETVAPFVLRVLLGIFTTIIVVSALSGIRDKLSRRKLTQRAATELYVEDESARDEFSFKLFESTVPTQYLRQVCAFNTKHPGLYPEISSHLLNTYAWCAEHYVPRVRHCAKVLQKAEHLNGEGYAFPHAKDIITQVIEYDRWGVSDRITDKQREALITVSLLLKNKLDPKVYPSKFPCEENYMGGMNAGSWLTDHVRAHPDSPQASYDAYVERSSKRERITRELDVAKDFPFDWIEPACDYPDALIDWMIGLRVKDGYLFSDLKWTAHRGATAQNMKEIRHFYETSETPRNSLTDAVIALRSYPEINHYADLTYAPKKVQEQCRALLLVGSVLLRNNEFKPSAGVIKDESLVQLLLKEPERAEAAVAILEARGTVDAELLEGTSGDVLGDGFL